MLIRKNHFRRIASASRCGADSEFNGIVTSSGRVSCPRGALEWAHAFADDAKILTVDLKRRFARDEDETDLPRSGLGCDGVLRLEAMEREADIGPTSAFRCYLSYETTGSLGPYAQLRHRFSPSGPTSLEFKL
jgi:hypothetical protein